MEDIARIEMVVPVWLVESPRHHQSNDDNQDGGYEDESRGEQNSRCRILVLEPTERLWAVGSLRRNPHTGWYYTGVAGEESVVILSVGSPQKLHFE